jgi:glycosyltransferase involved in cell wall biosynthesis
MKISFVIPYYQACDTLPRALASIYEPACPDGWSLEVVVVDDGSDDGTDALEITEASQYSVHFVRHETNRGTAAARNTGIEATTGDYVVMLDADDYLVSDWPSQMKRIIEEWPTELSVCWSWCTTKRGETTNDSERYSGPHTFEDFLADRHTGEYLPIFRGPYIRKHRYHDAGTKRGCEILTYLGMAREAPFWISPHVLRVYDTDRMGSITSQWLKPSTSAELVVCYEKLEELYGLDYERVAPLGLKRRRLRLAVYRRLARQKNYWRAWRRGAHVRLPLETIGAAVFILIGGPAIQLVIPLAKRLGLVRRFG